MFKQAVDKALTSTYIHSCTFTTFFTIKPPEEEELEDDLDDESWVSSFFCSTSIGMSATYVHDQNGQLKLTTRKFKIIKFGVTNVIKRMIINRHQLCTLNGIKIYSEECVCILLFLLCLNLLPFGTYSMRNIG